MHVVFLRLPGGRAATEQYLKELSTGDPYLERRGRYTVRQFPPGTMVGAYWSPPAALRRIPSSCHWASAEDAGRAEAAMRKAKNRRTRVDMALVGSG